eukprot:7874280-Ditylum_brightwellii.AAC.1
MLEKVLDLFNTLDMDKCCKYSTGMKVLDLFNTLDMDKCCKYSTGKIVRVILLCPGPTSWPPHPGPQY